MICTDLGGHSGCHIFLCETDDNRLFVRKIARDQEYNQRLQRQAEKQKEFSSLHIKTPSVLAEGVDISGNYYFDMEYVQGVTLAEYMKRIEIGKIRGLVGMIIDEIFSHQMTAGTCDTEKIFLEKINGLIGPAGDERGPFYMAKDKLLMHDWSHIRQSVCHGDLTLENIIVKNNEMYYIDFLDSFFDSYILDIATLLQDVQVMWSYRRDTKMHVNTSIRLIIFRDLLKDMLQEQSETEYREVLYALLLKLARIYPYVKDEATKDFLDKKTLDVLGIISREEEG